jgi:hypothetical protein
VKTESVLGVDDKDARCYGNRDLLVAVECSTKVSTPFVFCRCRSGVDMS